MWRKDFSDRKLNLDELKLLLEETKQNNNLGDIKWSIEQEKGNEEEKQIIKEIEEQLFSNNDKFFRFPTDFLHCQIAFDIYRNFLNEGELVKLNDKNEQWKVLKVFCEPEKPEKKKGSLYYGAIYENEKKRQLVLAHRGIDVNLLSLFDKNGAVKNQIEGIILQELIPQLAICYKVTQEANELAKTKGEYYLSFTGYSNGAWLAEYSIYFSNRYFRNPNTRAVLFESPGIVKNIEKFESNIIDDELKFNMENLNIVNYLTAPNFSNSINKHTGKVYRIFIRKNEKDHDETALNFLEEIKKIPKLGDWLYDKLSLKNYKYFLEGLIAMLTHKRLRKILEVFDETTGKPKYYEQMKRWPLIQFAINASSFDKKFKKLIEKPIETVFYLASSFIPFPKIPKDLVAWTGKSLLNFDVQKTIPGIHIFLNILIELLNENVNMKHFEHPSFYQQLVDQNSTNKINNQTSSNEFWCFLKNQYEPMKVNLNEQELIIKSDRRNLNWCLLYLKETDLGRDFSKQLKSKILSKQLKHIKSLYKIENSTEKGSNLNNVIIAKTESITIEELFEKLWRIIDIEPEIINLIDPIKRKKSNKKIEMCSHLMPRKEFIGRVTLLRQMKNLLFTQNKQTIILQALGGTGKSWLANEFAHQIKEKYSNYICYHFQSETVGKIESEYRSFSSKLVLEDSKKLEISELIKNVNRKLNSLSDEIKFLFIFDYVEKVEHIQVICKDLPIKNVKIIITTRNNLEDERLMNWTKLQVNNFSIHEAIDYIDKYMKTKTFKQKEKQQLIDIIKFEDQILPLKLMLIVKNMTENYFVNPKTLIEKISKQGAIKVNDIFFKDLSENAPNAFKILYYFSFMDPDMISYKICDWIESDGIQDNLNILNKLGFIDNQPESRCLKLHRMIQNSLRNYVEENRKHLKVKIKRKILDELLTLLNNHISFVENEIKNNDIKNQDLKYDFIQIEHLLRQIKYQNKLKVLLDLSQKLASYYMFSNINYIKANDYYQKTYELSKKLFKDDHSQIANSLNSLGLGFERLDNHQKASYYYLKAFEMRSRLYQVDHPDIAYSLKNLGVSYSGLDNDQKALEYFLKAFEMRSRLHKDDHFDIADSLKTLAVTYERLGDDQKALEYYLKAFEMLSRLFQSDHPDIAKSLYNLSACYTKIGENQKALEYDLKAFYMRSRLFKNDHPDLADSLHNLGVSFERLADDQKASNYYLKALEMRLRLYINDHPDIVDSLISLGISYKRLGCDQKALEYFLKAFEMRSRILQTDHPYIAKSLKSLGVRYERLIVNQLKTNLK